MKRMYTGAMLLSLFLASCKPATTPAKPATPTEVKDSKPTEPTKDPVKPAEPVPAPEPMAKGNPSDKLIPREVFFGNPERTGVQMSPDGKQLSWLAAKDGVLNVWVAPISDLGAAKAVTSDTARPVRQYFWAFNNTHLLYLQDKGGNENFHLFSVELSSGKTTDLTPAENVRAMVYGLSHKSPNKLIVGMNERDPSYHDAYEIDLLTGDKKLIAENKEQLSGYIFDNDLALRFSAKSNPDGSEQVLEKTKDGWKEKFVIPSEDSLTTTIIGFNKKNTAVYLMDSRDRDTAALYEMDIKTSKKKLLYEDARADVLTTEAHPTESTLQAVASEYERVQWKILDKKIQGDFDALGKVAEGDFYLASRSLDDQKWVVVYRSDKSPGKYYQWDRKKKAATFLFSDRPALDSLQLAKMTPVVIKSRDGLNLVSYLTLPNEADANGDGKPEKATPMVLLVHGGPWGRDRWGNNGYHQLLASRGYAVLSVNFRGSTGLGKKFLNEGNGQWGKKMHDDLLDAVDWAVAGNIAPKDKVCIMGGSYGGYATLVGLSMTPDVFACGVDIVGPSNIITLLNTIPPYWASGVAQFKTRVGDWQSEEGKKALMEVSPLTHASKIKRPLLIGQGANDPRVKQAESDQIVKEMQAKKIPVSYVLFPDEGHGFARPENNIAFSGVVEAFLSAHLGGVYQPLSKDELSKTTMKAIAGKNGIPGL